MLGNPKDFHYLNQSKCFKLNGVDDTEEYHATRRAMDIVGISQNEQVGSLANAYSKSNIFIVMGLFSFSGGNIQSRGCYSSSWKYRLFEGQGC